VTEKQNNSFVADGGWVEVKEGSRPSPAVYTILSVLRVFPDLGAWRILSRRTSTGKSRVPIPNPNVELRKLY
jgi:hypothetical protein